jgi:hypothetical protein
MRVLTVSVGYARTFNLGDYNSAKFEVAFSAEVDEGEDATEAHAALWAMARDAMRAQSLPVVAKRNAEVEKIRASVPELQGAS